MIVSSHAPVRGHPFLFHSLRIRLASFKSCPRKGASRSNSRLSNRTILFQVMPPQGGISLTIWSARLFFSFKSCPRKGASITSSPPDMLP